MISALPSAPPRPRLYVLYPSPVIKDWSAVNRRHTAPVCGPFAPPRLQYLQARCHTRCGIHSTPGIYVDVGIISLYPSSYATLSTSSASSSFFPPPLQLMMSLIRLSLLLLWAHSGACTVIIAVGSLRCCRRWSRRASSPSNQNTGSRVSTGGGIIFSVPGTRCSG